MSLRHRHDFLRIWTGQAVSNLGDGVHRIAVLWWARQATGSNLIVVMVALATVVPAVVAAPFAGWMVDRLPRRSLMIGSDLVRLWVSGTLAVLASSGALSTGAVVAAAIVSSAATSVFGPAYLASVTMLVADDELASANSLIGLNEAVAGIAGPAVGGLLIGVAGTSTALWFDAATFAVSMALVAASRVPMPARNVTLDAGEVDAVDGGGMLAGLALVRSDRTVRDIAVVAAGLNMFVSPVPVLIVALAAGPLALGGAGYGLLEACVPVGLVLGFLVGPRVSRFSWAALAGMAVTSVGVALVGASTVAVASAGTLVTAGVGAGVVNTILPMRLQRGVDPAMQGRVFAVLGGLLQAGRPLGLMLTVPLLAVAGARGGMLVCGAGMLLVTWIGRRGLGGGAETDVSHPLTEAVY
jgi:MFS family permease